MKQTAEREKHRKKFTDRDKKRFDTLAKNNTQIKKDLDSISKEVQQLETLDERVERVQKEQKEKIDMENAIDLFTDQQLIEQPAEILDDDYYKEKENLDQNIQNSMPTE